MGEEKVAISLPENLDSGQGFADKQFDAALKYLADRRVIPGFIVIRRNTIIDREGIDRLIVLPSGLVVAAQIKPKRSRHGLRKEIKRHIKSHPLIFCIFGIEKRHSARHLARRIVKKINKMIRKTQELDFRFEPQILPQPPTPL